jgi:hypothetical protein
METLTPEWKAKISATLSDKPKTEQHKAALKLSWQQLSPEERTARTQKCREAKAQKRQASK